MAAAKGISVSADGRGWTKDGESFAVGDFVFVTPDTFPLAAAAAKVDTEPVPGYAAKGGYVKVRCRSGVAQPAGARSALRPTLPVPRVASGKHIRSGECSVHRLQTMRMTQCRALRAGPCAGPRQAMYRSQATDQAEHHTDVDAAAPHTKMHHVVVTTAALGFTRSIGSFGHDPQPRAGRQQLGAARLGHRTRGGGAQAQEGAPRLARRRRCCSASGGRRRSAATRPTPAAFSEVPHDTASEPAAAAACMDPLPCCKQFSQLRENPDKPSSPLSTSTLHTTIASSRNASLN